MNLDLTDDEAAVLARVLTDITFQHALPAEPAHQDLERNSRQAEAAAGPTSSLAGAEGLWAAEERAISETAVTPLAQYG